MIEWDDMVDLVALAATFDQRKVSEIDVKAWQMVAQAERWDDGAAVTRVIVEHYSRDAARPRISPAAISDRLREIRRKAADSFEDPVIPGALPDGMTYPEWYREQMARHVAGVLHHWAETGAEPRPAGIEQGGPARLGEILAQAPEHVRPALEASMTRTMAKRA